MTEVKSKENVKVLITQEEIAQRIKAIAAEITQDYKNYKDCKQCQKGSSENGLVIIGVLKGAFVFMADLVREIELPCQLDFMMAQSYGQGTVSSGYVRIVKDIDTVIENRDVIVVEDILDTGNTLHSLCEVLRSRKPRSLKVCVFLDKKANRKILLEADYACFDVDNQFVVGYGLDYAEKYRNIPYLGVLE